MLDPVVCCQVWSVCRSCDLIPLDFHSFVYEHPLLCPPLPAFVSLHFLSFVSLHRLLGPPPVASFSFISDLVCVVYISNMVV